ncbi:nucleotide disphospho-sugar-binding domain-containing protein [Curtobacterium sp. L1-20]|uniref:nucleotide disphospho-sugar-binding domain-containing protein n=1 Tax=Curtobacterium sp. L1-20 TaxID=3138181 RepID=UPI003B51A06D
MTKIIVAATAIYGHVAPVLTITEDLLARGHEVVVLTGTAFADAVTRTGAAFEPLEGAADIDAAIFASPDRLAVEGHERLEWDLRHYVVGTVADQWRSLQRVLALPGNDDAVVLLESAFWGAAPGLAGAPGVAPRGYAVVGVVPLTLTSVDLAPFGSGLPPARTDAERAAYAEANAALEHGLFAGVQAMFVDAMRGAGVDGDVPYFYDAVPLLAQHYMQLSIRELSYEPSDLPSTISFIGTLPVAATPSELPDWWSDVLDADRVVAVSQGTMANTDLSELIQPTLDALADLDVLVVATTGSEAVVDSVPANARVARFVPFADLLPHVDVLVTNGGFGGTQQALRAGVPMVLAGLSEDKAEGNARTSHTGAAIDLRTQRPTPGQLRDAVRSVLDDPSYRDRARALQRTFAESDPLGTIAATVEELASRVRADRSATSIRT